MANILSIDWDYFFPDFSEYDWGSLESYSPELLNVLWSLRQRSFKFANANSDSAIKEYIPSNYEVLEILCKSTPKVLFITNSHKHIIELLNNFNNYFPDSPVPNLYNFDQHHDLGYKKEHKSNPNEIEPTCDNWAIYALKNNLINNYDLHYPSWRENKAETKRLLKKIICKDAVEHKINVSYENIQNLDLPTFDALFICRSDTWTPPWSDHQWMEFIFPILTKTFQHSVIEKAILEPRPIETVIEK